MPIPNIAEEILSLDKRTAMLQSKIDELRKNLYASKSLSNLADKEKLRHNNYCSVSLGSLTESEQKEYQSHLKKLAAEVNYIDARLAFCSKQERKILVVEDSENMKECHKASAHTIHTLTHYIMDQIESIKELQKMVDRNDIEAPPIIHCGGRERETNGEEAVIYIIFQLHHRFGIDASSCNVVEHTFLALAGIEERPLECVFDSDLDPRKRSCNLK